MAQSFWNKRTGSVDTSGEYPATTSGISKTGGILLTVAGIVVVGGLLFGVFSGARWAYGKLAGNDATSSVSTIENSPATITSTSSTSTSAPSTSGTITTEPAPVTASAPTAPATTPAKLPQTGAGSNTALFIILAAVGYLAYRKKLLRNQ